MQNYYDNNKSYNDLTEQKNKELFTEGAATPLVKFLGGHPHSPLYIQ